MLPVELLRDMEVAGSNIHHLYFQKSCQQVVHHIMQKLANLGYRDLREIESHIEQISAKHHVKIDLA